MIKTIVGLVLLICSVVLGYINGKTFGYNIVPESNTELTYLLVSIGLFIIGVIVSYIGLVDINKVEANEVKNCSTCKFNDYYCNVGSICYNGELWEKTCNNN